MNKLKVCSHKCDQCLFSKDKIVSNERKQEILEGCQREGKYFICHKSTIKDDEVVCAGFAASKYNKSAALQVAQRLEKMTGKSFIKYVNPEEI